MQDCPSTASKYRKYIQFLLWRLQLPLSTEELSEHNIGALRQMASMFRAYSGIEFKDYTKDDLIRFICGHQQNPEAYKPLPKIPGLIYPKVSEQRYRSIFESKVDHWQRP